MKKMIQIFAVGLVISMLAACGQKETAPTETAEAPAAEAVTEEAQTAETTKATDYPTSQITIIIGANPGGLSDLCARTVGSVVSDKLGVPVVFVNKPGASHAVAMSYVQASKGDGYTIGFVPAELTMVESLGYATDVNPGSFNLICSAFQSAATITVPADAPYDTVEELVEWCKAHPGELTVGNSGTGSIWHLAALSFAEQAGIEINHVPYDGASAAVTDLLGGHIDAVTVSEMEIISGVKNGDFKILGIMSEEKSSYNPEIPVLSECGYDVSVSTWGGFVAPKDTPSEIMDVLYEAFDEAVESEDWKNICESNNVNVMHLEHEAFTEFANSQYEFYTDKLANIEF